MSKKTEGASPVRMDKLKKTVASLKRLTWPTPKEVLSGCGTVLGLSAVTVVCVWLLDTVFGAGFHAILTLLGL